MKTTNTICVQKAKPKSTLHCSGCQPVRTVQHRQSCNYCLVNNSNHSMLSLFLQLPGNAWDTMLIEQLNHTEDTWSWRSYCYLWCREIGALRLHQVHEMQTIVTDDLSIGLSVYHASQLSGAYIVCGVIQCSLCQITLASFLAFKHCIEIDQENAINSRGVDTETVCLNYQTNKLGWSFSKHFCHEVSKMFRVGGNKG